MRSLIFGLIILGSLNSHAIFGLGKSKEEKQCITDLTSGVYIAEKSAKNLCKNNSSPVIVQCVIYFGKRANIQAESGYNICLDGLQYQSSNFQNYETCIVAMVGKGKAQSEARNKCIYDVNAYLVPDAAPAPQPAPVSQQPAWPTTPEPTWPSQSTEPTWNTPTPTPSTPPKTMSKVPDYLKTEPSLDPMGQYIPEMPAEEVVVPGTQGPAAGTPPVMDVTQDGTNYIPLDL